MNSKGLIEGFINEHVTRKGLDGRTEKAYRLDLKHFCTWMEAKRTGNSSGDEDSTANLDRSVEVGMNRLEDWLERYLAVEKKLDFATVSRKNRVFDYYSILPGKAWNYSSPLCSETGKKSG